MNCMDFQSIVLELDRDDGVIEPALAHAATCADCEARLESARELRAALKALARQDDPMEAPAHVEAALLATIRGGRAVVGSGFSSRRLLTVPGFRLALAAAAALILVALATFIIYTRSRGEAPTMARKDSVPSSPGGAKDSKKGDPKESIPRNGSAAPDEATEHGPQAIAQDRGPARNKARRLSRRNSNSPEGDDSNEIATDYFPISYGSYMQPLDSGQIVRIKLPRSALMNYGLPVDPLRADEAIKADVVIGNDGMARAIRFVH
jgi:hypothetical protein